MQLTSDVGDKQGWHKHADADFVDLFCTLPIKQIELAGGNAIADHQEDRKRGLSGTQDRSSQRGRHSICFEGASCRMDVCSIGRALVAISNQSLVTILSDHKVGEVWSSSHEHTTVDQRSVRSTEERVCRWRGLITVPAPTLGASAQTQLISLVPRNRQAQALAGWRPVRQNSGCQNNPHTVNVIRTSRAGGNKG